MEELVTVDEVGEDDDSIIEPDLPELEKFVSCPKGATEGEAAEAKEEEEEEELSPPRPCVDAQKTPAETSVQDRLSSEVGDPAEAAGTVEPEAVVSAGSPEDPSLQRPQRPAAPEPALADVPPEEQTCSEDKDTSDEPPEESPQHHTSVSEEPEPVEAGPVAETVKMEVQARRGGLNRGITELLQTQGVSSCPCSSLCGSLSQSLRSPHHVWGRRKLPLSTASLWVNPTTLKSQPLMNSGVRNVVTSHRVYIYLS